MAYAFRFPPLMALLVVGACTTVPSGPGVLVLPGTGKSFEQFHADDYECRQFASAQVGGTTSNQAASDSAVKRPYPPWKNSSGSEGFATSSSSTRPITM